MANPTSTRTTIKRNAKRAEYSRETILDILATQQLCHVAYVQDGEPRQIPTLYFCDAEYMYLHGNRQSALLKHMAAGGEVSVTVTAVDGLVVARSGFHCSMNYRSVTLYGSGEAVTDEQHRWALDQFVAVLVPGHEKAVREHTPQELAATAVCRVPLDEMVAKVRDGDPIDDKADMNADVWAGVIPIQQVAHAAIDSTDLKPGIEQPEYIKNYRHPG